MLDYFDGDTNRVEKWGEVDGDTVDIVTITSSTGLQVW